MIKNLELFARELEKINGWWLTGKIRLEQRLLERQAQKDILRELKGKRIIQIIGARRVGKTVIIRQTIKKLLEDTDPRNILYYSLDDPGLLPFSDNLLKDTLDYFLDNIAGNGRKYVFFDEVHVFHKWWQWLKSFFDRYDDVKFIVSGSSSLAIQIEANRFLRGRTFDVEIFPFSFQEFLSFSGISVEKRGLDDWFKMGRLEKSKLEKSTEKVFKEFLLVGGFPEWFEVKDVRDWFERLIDDIPKKAVYEDIQNKFGIKNPKFLESLFSFMVSNQSKILSYEKINETVRLNRATLLNYIEYLKSSYLIIEIPKFSKSIKEQIKSMKKFLVIDQGLRNAILKDYELRVENMGFVIENVVGVYLSGHDLSYLRTNGEIDFIVREKSPIPIEVKYSESPALSRTFLNFLSRNGIEFGVVVTKNTFEKRGVDDKIIYFIPAWALLLTNF
jgi:predicted AAA+ superfamily ATPase